MATRLIPHCNTLIVDIGDVLYTWSPTTPTPISSRTLKTILSSPSWGHYECGKLSETEVYERTSTEYGVDVSNLARAFQHARESLEPNIELVSFIDALKKESEGTLRVFAMSNISQPDYEFLLAQNSIDWSIFDGIFTSAAAGMRKPDLCFFKYVIQETSCDPSTTIFVDDKAENVLSARSLGMRGVVYAELSSVRTALRIHIDDPVQRGWTYLRNHEGKHISVTQTGVIIEENFTQLLLLELTKDRQLVNLEGLSASGKVNFFKGKPLLTTTEYPDDFDTTAIALTVLDPKDEVVDAVMGEILQYHNEDGIVLTYFDRTRPRMDPAVCVNVMTLFHSRNRGDDPNLAPTQNWVLDVLRHRAYLDGTRYYTSPEAFLYFLSRLLVIAPEATLSHDIRPILRERLQERVGVPCDALTLAMRIVACEKVEIRDTVDVQTLLSLQNEDGSWGPGKLYRYGSTDINVGNFGLATALAVRAIEVHG